MKTVAIINDQPLLTKGLCFILKDTYKQLLVLESISMVHFRELYPDKNPQIVILNIHFNAESDCMNFVLKAKSEFPQSRIIAFIDSQSTLLIASYFKNGIHAIISTKSTFDEITRCLDTVIQGKPCISQDLFFIMMPCFSQLKRKISAKGTRSCRPLK